MRALISSASLVLAIQKSGIIVYIVVRIAFHLIVWLISANFYCSSLSIFWESEDLKRNLYIASEGNYSEWWVQLFVKYKILW